MVMYFEASFVNKATGRQNKLKLRTVDLHSINMVAGSGGIRTPRSIRAGLDEHWPFASLQGFLFGQNLSCT